MKAGSFILTAIAGVQPALSALSQTEQIFTSIPKPESLRESLKFYTSIEHMAGTPGDYETARYTAEKFREFGIDARLDKHRVLLSQPVRAQVSIVEPAQNKYMAKLEEDYLPIDELTNTIYRNHTFNAYGASGNVTGDLVYANYGRVEDFDHLENLGIDLKGKIVIVRYGECFRGLKVKNAQDRGAIGVLIYSDPIDDGFTKGKAFGRRFIPAARRPNAVYPNGPWRPASAVQRGSVVFNSLCGGDPGQVEREGRCGMKTEDLIPKIPAHPLGYGDAQRLMEKLQGSIPDGWKGGMQIDYRVGPGPVKVNMDIENTRFVGDIWNVIARIPGTHEPDRIILVGNHRDAWVYGAVDPNSGTAGMLEVARGLGELLRRGWRPRRTIVFGSWDGEEYNLQGSTAWGEENADELARKAIAYVNVDCGVSGQKGAAVSATPSLNALWRSVLEEVKAPDSDQTLLSTWDGKVGRLGSGSDYTVFLDVMGIPSMDFGFKGDYGVYHSVYDSFHWMDNFGDPGFKWHTTLARTFGLVVLRLADSKIVPMQYTEYAEQLAIYADERDAHMRSLHVQLEKQAATKEHGKGADFAPLRHAIELFAMTSIQMDAQRATYEELIKYEESNGALEMELRRLNDGLAFVERHFIDPYGLALRPWFKHLIVAPGLHTGYAANVYPGIADALTDSKDVDDVQGEILRVALRIREAAAHMARHL